MSEKDPKVFVSHILDCIQKVEEYTEGKTKEDFMNSSQLQDAVIRRIEIIGEASRNIPSKIQEKYSHIHWEEAKGTRNILIHEYFGVDLELTWQVVKQDLPKLREQMLALKEELAEESDTS